MRASIAVALLAAAVLGGAVARATTEQTIVPLNPGVEQRVQPIGGPEGQRVEGVAGAEEQRIGAHVPPTPAEKTASNVGKVVLGITGAAVALGAMAASLIFL